MPSKSTPKSSSYAAYWEAAVNQPAHYPLEQSLASEQYRPLGEWMGRLILPDADARDSVLGTLMEVYHADAAHQHLVGQIVRLRWQDDVETNARLWSVTQPVVFDDNAHKVAAAGSVVPDRLNQRGPVNPFESLAGSHPHDDIVVRLHGPVTVQPGTDGEQPIVFTPREPVQITGRYYALARFIKPIDVEAGLYRVAHYDRQQAAFDGPVEIVRLPHAVADRNGIRPSVNQEIEQSPANEDGWYLYGAQDAEGLFTVQALAPRALLRCQPGEFLVGQKAGKAYLSPSNWRRTAEKGTLQTALICPDASDPQACLAAWQEGDAMLVVHLYGGIGGPKGEREARGPVYWGHFAFGVAHVMREPLADELIFDIEYHQVYAHNPDGLTAGTLHWSRYAGDRQYGWLGVRPIQDMLIKLDCFTQDFVVGKLQRSALTQMALTLEVMTARYRIADGRGGTQVSASNNCAQDSAQALYSAIRDVDRALRTRPDFQAVRQNDPHQAERMDELLELGDDLRKMLLPFGSARADWEWGMATIGSSLANNPVDNLSMALRTWRTMLPSIAVRCVAEVFAKHDAMIWVLRTNQVGGNDPDVAPRIPNV